MMIVNKRRKNKSRISALKTAAIINLTYNVNIKYNKKTIFKSVVYTVHPNKMLWNIWQYIDILECDIALFGE